MESLKRSGNQQLEVERMGEPHLASRQITGITATISGLGPQDGRARKLGVDRGESSGGKYLLSRHSVHESCPHLTQDADSFVSIYNICSSLMLSQSVQEKITPTFHTRMTTSLYFTHLLE